VVRGGSFFDFDFSLRAAARSGFSPDYRNSYIGFRVVSSRLRS
jgi:formylglycine-generating enzyme required for sulfatase activity